MANIQLRNFKAVKWGAGSCPLHPTLGGKKGGGIQVVVPNMKMLIPAWRDYELQLFTVQGALLIIPSNTSLGTG